MVPHACNHNPDSVTLLGVGLPARAEPIVPHPDLYPLPLVPREHQLGHFGETLVREYYRAAGARTFDLNIGRNGIDSLMAVTNPDGSVDYRVLEVKTRSEATTFAHAEQLQEARVRDRLSRAVHAPPDLPTRAAAKAALSQVGTRRLTGELHVLLVKDDVYQVHCVDMATGKVVGPPASGTVTGALTKLSDHAADPATRQAARRHLDGLDRLRRVAVPNPPVIPVPAKPTGHAPAPAKPAGTAQLPKGARVVAKRVAVVGVAVEVHQQNQKWKSVEEQYQSGAVTDQERVHAHSRDVAGGVGGTAGAAAGAYTLGSAGAALGSIGGPGGALVGGAVGSLAGGVIGYVAGEAAAQEMVDAGKEWIYNRVRWARRAIHGDSE